MNRARHALFDPRYPQSQWPEPNDDPNIPYAWGMNGFPVPAPTSTDANAMVDLDAGMARTGYNRLVAIVESLRAVKADLDKAPTGAPAALLALKPRVEALLTEAEPVLRGMDTLEVGSQDPAVFRDRFDANVDGYQDTIGQLYLLAMALVPKFDALTAEVQAVANADAKAAADAAAEKAAAEKAAAEKAAAEKAAAEKAAAEKAAAEKAAAERKSAEQAAADKGSKVGIYLLVGSVLGMAVSIYASRDSKSASRRGDDYGMRDIPQVPARRRLR
jgi:hypothetical protein